MAGQLPIPYDLDVLYRRIFGTKPHVPTQTEMQQWQQPFSISGATQVSNAAPDGSTLYKRLHGIEVWLPIVFRDLDNTIFEGGKLEINYATISISGSANWVETQLAERRGSAKELYSINDYRITIKGFFIDQARVWPYDDLASLKKVHEAGQAFSLDNALTNIYIPSEDKVVLKSFDLPAVEGKSNHVRPFSMQLASDSIFVLEIE